MTRGTLFALLRAKVTTRSQTRHEFAAIVPGEGGGTKRPHPYRVGGAGRDMA